MRKTHCYNNNNNNNNNNKLIETDDIKIKCGIFEGDPVSPLQFSSA